MSQEIRNGHVFSNGNFEKKTIFLLNDKISFKNTSCENLIDATGFFVLPGLIDMHVHFRDYEESYKEDWTTGSVAAARGGITTVFDMPNNKIPITSKKLYNEKIDLVKKKSILNFGIYIALTNENIDEVNKSGIKYGKLYYGMTTGEIKVNDAEEIFKNLNNDVLIVAHAEENEVIKKNESLFDKNLINYHSLVRDNNSESIAVKKLLHYSMKYKKKLHLTHIGTKDSMELIKAAKLKNPLITCDTCPHYLFLDDTAYEKLRNKAKVNPPLRKKEYRESLWNYLNEGIIDCVCSDHAPHTLEEKERTYELCPAGFPGVETTLRLILTAVNEKKINLEIIPKILSENPARILGLKTMGKIDEGKNSSLTIIDLKKESAILGKELYTKAKWTPFEGMKTIGDAVYTIINGNIAYDGSEKETIFAKEKGKCLSL